MITVTIGDIHGCLEELLQLMEKVQERTQPDKFVFLGDYIDRGPDSKGVVDYLMTLEPEKCVFLRGNHEDMMLTGDSGWLMNGGLQTLQSYELELSYNYLQNMPANHIDWFKATKLYFKDDKRTYVHAGIDRDIPLDKQSKFVLTWIREQFLNNNSDKGGYVVHGHTPRFQVELKNNRCNLDTACVFGGKLTAGVFADNKEQPVMLIDHKGGIKDVS